MGDPESPDQGQPADLGPGVDPRGPGVEQDQGQGVLGGDQGQAVQPNQGQEAQQSQGRGVQPNLDLGVQQGQGPQAHQGQGQGLPEAIESNHQFNAQAMCCYCLYCVDSSAPISYFWLS